MELFISSNLTESKLSLTLQFYTTYLRAQTRKIVNLVPLTQAAQSALKITNVSLDPIDSPLIFLLLFRCLFS